MEMSSCFPELGMDDCNNFIHLMQAEEYGITNASTQQLASFSSENTQAQTLTSCTKHSRSVANLNLGSTAQPESQQFGWVLKPKNEEIVYNNELMLSFPSGFNWNTNGSTSSSRKHLSKSVPNIASKDHILAERRRRENISQRLIALSAIIPGLKKMDKASVLESATKYVKKLEECIRSLEEEMKKKKSLESVVLVKKSQISGSEDDSSCDDDQVTATTDQEGLPEIEIRISDKRVLIKIFCEKYKNFLPKLFAKVENLHLTILNSIALPFGSYAMDITISAQMDAEFCLSQRDLVRILHSILNGFVENASQAQSVCV